MADAKFDIRTEATRPFYATVGATDLAVEVARNYVNDLQSRVADVQKKVAAFELEPKTLNEKAVAGLNTRREALTKDAKDAQSKLEARLKELQAELKDAQSKLEAKVSELQVEAKAFPTKVQTEVKDLVADATKAYEDFTKRGEGVVAKLRKVEPATTTAVIDETPAVDEAPKPAKKAPAKKAPAKKAPAKKTAAKKTTESS